MGKGVAPTTRVTTVGDRYPSRIDAGGLVTKICIKWVVEWLALCYGESQRSDEWDRRMRSTRDTEASLGLEGKR